MKSFCLAALLGLFACQLAYAADDAGGAAKAARQATKSVDPAVATQGAAKPIKMSQQDRMRLCSKEASGKKGAERKAFMKSCLTTKKS